MQHAFAILVTQICASVTLKAALSGRDDVVISPHPYAGI